MFHDESQAPITSAGLGEVGIRWKPAPGNGFSVDFAVQGFIGKREGVAGNVSLKYEF